MSKLFNTVCETKLRILLLLHVMKERRASVDRLTALDFMVVYGRDFSISEENLHGNNRLNFSEYTDRRELINDAIKCLVLRHYVSFYYDKSGFSFSINSGYGVSLCNSLNDIYAERYVLCAKKAVEETASLSDREILLRIASLSIK